MREKNPIDYLDTIDKFEVVDYIPDKPLNPLVKRIMGCVVLTSEK